MAENESRICSINRCMSTAVEEDRGVVGGWSVSIPYCDEHARQMREGTPLGPVGIDASRVIVEPLGSDEPATQSGRFPGIA